MEDAKRTLGFPPDSSPSASEVRDAYLQKAKVMHPDIGGDLEQMKELNVAKDILEGKARPTYDRRPETTSTRSRWDPPKADVITFDEAKAKADIPSGIQWLFVTDRQRGKSNWNSDESSNYESAFVAYGRTEQQHVFVGAYYRERHDFYIGGTENRDTWAIKSFKMPIRDAKEGINPAWLYGHVLSAFKDIGFNGRFNSKIFDAREWTFKEKLPTGATASIKHWLVNSGQVEGNASTVVKRKHIVSLRVNQSFDSKPGYYSSPFSFESSYFQLVLIINGKEYPLSERDWVAFAKTRLQGKFLTTAIFGQYYYQGSEKTLTRLRSGKIILGWMIHKFVDLPSDAIEILKAAEAQMKGTPYVAKS